MNHRVLIVDRSSETRELLRTVLQQRGIQTLEASATGQGLELAREHRPQVIVVDLEHCAGEADAKAVGGAEWQAQDARMVFLSASRGRYLDRVAGEFVLKPYHYAPLLRKIESLLERSPEPLKQMA